MKRVISADGALRATSSFFAILSDIHANIDALNAVLEDLAAWPCRGIFCLGDIVGYGPEPARCVQRVREVCSITVIGNHEAMLLASEKYPPAEWGATVGQPIQLAIEQLDEAQRQWISELPLVADVSPLMLSHASLHQPEYFHYVTNEREARAGFTAQEGFISFHGHSHVPAIWELKGGSISCFQPSPKPVILSLDNRYAVNVGSVGQPRDDDPRASYALYDYENRILIHRRVDYDIERATARFREAGLPEYNSQRLVAGR